MQQRPQQQRSKNLGTLLVLVIVVIAWIMTPWLMDLQDQAAQHATQLEQQDTTLQRSLAKSQAEEKEFNSKSTAERLKVIAAIPETGKISQSNVLREVEGIISGTSVQLRSISFDTGTYSEGAGPRAIPMNLELTSPDAATILQVLKKFEDTNRLYREESMTLTRTETGVGVQMRFNVYSRE